MVRAGAEPDFEDGYCYERGAIVSGHPYAAALAIRFGHRWAAILLSGGGVEHRVGPLLGVDPAYVRGHWSAWYGDPEFETSPAYLAGWADGRECRMAFLGSLSRGGDA